MVAAEPANNEEGIEGVCDEPRGENDRREGGNLAAVWA
jgi:hypothetical protein